MKNQLLLGAIATGSLLLGSAFGASSASALSFTNVAGGSTEGDAFASEYSFDVESIVGGTSIKINNLGPSTFIKEVYFDDADPSVLGTFDSFGTNIGTVSYVEGASPGNLPQGNNISFVSDVDFDPAGGDGAFGNAIDAGESLVLNFSGETTAIVNALLAGTLRLGIHSGIYAGGSDSYVSCSANDNCDPPEEVPTPAAVLPIIGGLFGAASRRKKGESTEA